MAFKFEGGQKIFVAQNGHPVTVVARTEFFNGKQPRYCVESETAIPGKNMAQDWINEDQLTDQEPVLEPEVDSAEEAKEQSGQNAFKKAVPTTQGKRMRGSPQVRQIKKPDQGAA